MDDLRERDLSQIPDEDLSPEERRELERRFAELVTQVRAHYTRPNGGGREPAARARPETLQDARRAPVAPKAWDPIAARRRR